MYSNSLTEVATPLLGFTCHMGSHSVTCQAATRQRWHGASRGFSATAELLITVKCTYLITRNEKQIHFVQYTAVCALLICAARERRARCQQDERRGGSLIRATPALHCRGTVLTERRRGIIALVLLRQIEHCPHRLADLATHGHDHTLSLQGVVGDDLSFVSPLH